MTPIIFAFVLGAAVGSFLNVVSLRFGTGRSLGGRSKCMSCGTTLTWKELVPLASFFWQRGSCRKCKSKISWQYPLVEFAAGAVFALIFLRFPPVSAPAALATLIQVAAACLLLVIAAYDIRHKIIPDSFAYSFAGLAFLALFVGGDSWLHIPGIWALLAGPLIALPFAVLWLASRGKWMGLGDAKLALGLGWFLGLGAAGNAIILAFWIAAAASILWLVASGQRFRKGTEVAFGPYLIIGMYVVLLFNVQVIDFGLLNAVLFH